jgi:hypothetical protein
MKPFDFAKFKKIAEDAKSVTMEHPLGHSMTIAIMALPKIQREQLKMLPLAKGGEVNYEKGVHPPAVGFHEGIKGMSKSGPAARSKDKDKQEYAKRNHRAVLGELKDMPKPKIQGFADKGLVTQDPTEENQQTADQQPQAEKPPVNISINAQPQGQPSQPVAPQPVAPQPVMQNPTPEVQVPQVGTAATPINSGGGIENQAGSTLKGIEQGQEAIKSKEAIDEAEAKGQVPIVEQEVLGNQQRARQAAQAYADFQTRGNAAIKKLAKGEVDPNRFWNDRKTGEKIGTTIGLFLGGFGVPFGGHNFAYDKLQADINRDVEAQKKNADIRNNVWSAYKNLYELTPVADQLTKATLLDTAAAQMRVQAAKLGTARAHYIAQKTTADYAKESHGLRTSAAAIYTEAHGGKAVPQPPQSPAAVQKTESPAKPLTPDEQAKQNADKMAGKEALREKPLSLEDLPNDKVLDEGAEQRMLAAKEGPYKEQFGDIQKQYDAAVQTDKALAGLNQRYLEMAALADKGGIGGYIHRKIDPHTIAATVGGLGALAGSVVPGLGTIAGGAGGAALGEAIGQSTKAATAGDIAGRYDAAKTNLLQEIGSALHGTDVSPSQIEAAVNAYAPDIRDSREGRIEKIKGLRRFMINAARTSMLGLAKVSRKNP